MFQRVRNVIVLTSAWVAVATAMSSMLSAQGPPTTKTVVTNTTAQPVPVAGSVNANITNPTIPVTGTVNANVTNTPNVNIANTPTVNVNPSTTIGTTDTATLNVVRLTAVLTIPSGFSCTAALATTLQFGSYTVPSNSRLVLTHISFFEEVAPGDPPGYGFVGPEGATYGSFGPFFLYTPMNPVNDALLGAFAAPVYVDPGGAIEVGTCQNRSTGSGTAYANLQGYLVNCGTAGCSTI